MLEVGSYALFGAIRLIPWVRRISSREALLGRMITRYGAGLRRSACVLAGPVVADTGGLRKLAAPTTYWRTTLNTCLINFRHMRTKSTIFL